MFEQEKTENYCRRVAGSLKALPRRYTAFLILAATLLVPYPTTVVPEWKVRVVGPSGEPAAGVSVRECWQHYSLEGEGYEEDRVTDGDGYVVFPERKIWSPLLWRIVSTSFAALLTIAHGSMGPHAYLIGPGDSTHGGDWHYVPGRPLPGEIRLRR